MLARCCWPPARRSCRRTSRAARSTRASAAGPERADADPDRVPGGGARQLGRHLRPDLPDQLGRPARAPGPAHPAVRAPPAALDRLLLAQQGRRADLAAHERRAGARPARDRGHPDALLVDAHADRDRGDPVRARPGPRPGHVPHLPGAAGRQRRFRIASTGAYRLTREKIALVTAYLQETLSGVRVVRAFGQEPRHGGRFAELNDEHREANMRTVYLNAAYFPAVELLSAVATAAILIYGGNQVLDGERHDRRARLVRLLPAELLRPDPVALAALHDLPGGHGRARQDLRAARRGARHRRPAGARSCRACAARSSSTT